MPSPVTARTGTMDGLGQAPPAAPDMFAKPGAQPSSTMPNLGIHRKTGNGGKRRRGCNLRESRRNSRCGHRG